MYMHTHIILYHCCSCCSDDFSTLQGSFQCVDISLDVDRSLGHATVALEAPPAECSTELATKKKRMSYALKLRLEIIFREILG